MKNKKLFWWTLTLSPLVVPFVSMSCVSNKLSKKQKNILKAAYEAKYDSKFDRKLTASENQKLLEKLGALELENTEDPKIKWQYKLNEAPIVEVDDKKGTLTIEVSGIYEDLEFPAFKLTFDGFKKVEE